MAGTRPLFLPLLAFFLALSLQCLGGGLFYRKANRLCINSQVPGFQSMCVLCDPRYFQQTTLRCTGNAFVPANTTETEAMCLINDCLNQIPQSATTMAGRRRRSTLQSEQIESQKLETTKEPTDKKGVKVQLFILNTYETEVMDELEDDYGETLD